MRKKFLAVLAAGIFLFSMVGMANANIIINDSTMGYYNQAIGTSLNLTNPYAGSWLFPGDYQTYGDPTFVPVPFEPDLSTASSALGNWLGDPANLNSNWNYQSIPGTWTVNDETAIVYAIDAGTTGLDNVTANFGVDNGMFVWLDGTFLSGWLQPGGAGMYEYSLALGSLSAVTHYLEILREDHGGATGYHILVEGDTADPTIPEPTTMLLFGSGLLGLAGYRKRK